jgi:hypothetical protein
MSNTYLSGISGGKFRPKVVGSKICPKTFFRPKLSSIECAPAVAARWRRSASGRRSEADDALLDPEALPELVLEGAAAVTLVSLEIMLTLGRIGEERLHENKKNSSSSSSLDCRSLASHHQS